jgi:hypothetical protein
MKYARIPRPEAPPALSAGIDWASAGHAVCIVDAAGAVVSRFTVAHTAEGLRTLVQRLARAEAAEVAIERGDGPIVDALLAAGLRVVVITRRQVKNSATTSANSKPSATKSPSSPPPEHQAHEPGSAITPPGAAARPLTHRFSD